MLRSTRRRSASRACIGAMLVIMALTGCPKPPPDLDGHPGGARPLALGTPRRDQLHCKGGDCADWYRLRVEQRGELVIEVAAIDENASTTFYSLQLNSHRNEPLGYGDPVGLGRKRLHWSSDPGTYLVGIAAPEKSRPFRYEVLASFEPEPPRLVAPPPPPQPRFESISAEVIEIEGRPGDPRAVLIDRGRSDGMRPGLRGRLLENGEEIATVEIVDAYADGSRARIEGSLQAPITAHTLVEIDVPVSDNPGASPTEPDGSPPRSD
jgi:hypothetical protein